MKLFVKMLKWLFIISLVLFALLQIDDRQSQESINWNQEVQNISNSESQAFYLQLGMFAPADKDPIAFGKLRLDEAEKVYGDYLSYVENDKFPIDFQDPIANKLNFSYPKNFCSLNENDCVKTIKATPEFYNSFVQSNQILLKRYKQYLKLKDFRVTTNPNTMLYFTDSQPLPTANKLLQLDILINSKDLEKDTVGLINATRLKLAQSNTLLSKMVHHAITQLNLDFYHQLLKAGIIKGKQPLANATKEELSLEMAIKTEHAVAADQIRLLDEGSGIGILEPLKQLWWRALLKENISINENYQVMQSWLAFANLPSEEQAELGSVNTPDISFLEKHRNYAGWGLSVVVASAYSDYSKRIHNLQAKINLINWYHQNKPESIGSINSNELISLNNFGLKAPLLDTKNSQLCLDVPQKHPKNHHCIWI